MAEFRRLLDKVEHLDESAWYAMVDFITIYSKDDVQFNFKNGMEIPV